MKYKNIKNLKEFEKDYKNLTVSEMIIKYNINHKTILSYSKKLGISRKQGEKKKYSVNDYYFSSNNECSNKYYILGLIFTDGNLPKTRNCFIISNTDKNLLENILKELSYTGVLYEEHHNKFNKNIYKLRITSSQIRKDLESFGLIPNKTQTLKFPNIPKEYLGDFCRGLWDGDGSVSNPLSTQKIKTLLSSSFVCANKEFISDLINKLPVNCKTIFKSTKNRINPQYSINLRGFDSLRLKEFFYKDNNCLCMTRKKDKFFNYKPRRSENTISSPIV